MVGRIFQIYDVQMTENNIWKFKKTKVVTFHHSLSPFPRKQRKISYFPKQCFFENLLSPPSRSGVAQE